MASQVPPALDSGLRSYLCEARAAPRKQAKAASAKEPYQVEMMAKAAYSNRSVKRIRPRYGARAPVRTTGGMTHAAKRTSAPGTTPSPPTKKKRAPTAIRVAAMMEAPRRNERSVRWKSRGSGKKATTPYSNTNGTPSSKAGAKAARLAAMARSTSAPCSGRLLRGSSKWSRSLLPADATCGRVALVRPITRLGRLRGPLQADIDEDFADAALKQKQRSASRYHWAEGWPEAHRRPARLVGFRGDSSPSGFTLAAASVGERFRGATSAGLSAIPTAQRSSRGTGSRPRKVDEAQGGHGNTDERRAARRRGERWRPAVRGLRVRREARRTALRPPDTCRRG